MFLHLNFAPGLSSPQSLLSVGVWIFPQDLGAILMLRAMFPSERHSDVKDASLAISTLVLQCIVALKFFAFLFQNFYILGTPASVNGPTVFIKPCVISATPISCPFPTSRSYLFYLLFIESIHCLSIMPPSSSKL